MARSGLPEGGANYSSGARAAAASMQKQYGSGWKNVYFGLANKRVGKGARGKTRMHTVASVAYAKGSKWGGKGKVRRSRTRIKG